MLFLCFSVIHFSQISHSAVNYSISHCPHLNQVTISYSNRSMIASSANSMHLFCITSIWEPASLPVMMPHNRNTSELLYMVLASRYIIVYIQGPVFGIHSIIHSQIILLNKTFMFLSFICLLQCASKLSF